MALLKWGYKRARELARRMGCYRGEYVANHPEFAKASVAVCQEEIKPAAVDAPDLVYSEEDERAIDAYTRKFGESGQVRSCDCAGVLIWVWRLV